MNEFEFGYKVFWEGTELVSYWGFYLPSEMQDTGTALENIARDRTAIVAKKDWETVKRQAREQNQAVSA